MHHQSTAVTQVEIRHYHVCCGGGPGARGFNMGSARVGNLLARMRCIGGVDHDPLAITDFDRLAGVKGTLLDLFSAEQYRAFHGKEPPAGWREATPNDIRRSAGGEFPHIVFTSMPCKGFSGLLAESRSASAKYQALNGLTLRGVWLTLEAFKDDPPELWIFENVPRIANRGRHLLDQIKALFRAHGYAVEETAHDCGEIGGLSQSRKRFLMVARHMAKVPPFLYEPPKKRLRGVGDVLDRLPMPGDPCAGPMHRSPSLQWKTWVRLAFVQAGKDWRSLNRLTAGMYGVLPYEAPAGSVNANACHDNGKWSVADPRLPALDERLACVIIAEDATWHRPFTTLELAALQTMFDPDEEFEPVRTEGGARIWQRRKPEPWMLAGTSDSRHRECIGNAVPSAAAQAIASTMAHTLLLAWSGHTFVLSNTPIWVMPPAERLRRELAIALSVTNPFHNQESNHA